MGSAGEHLMDVWFVRSNGETGHNQPGTKLYVPGEPPNFPARVFNHRLDCLAGGFARIGWPASGDLHELGWRVRARDAYGEITSRHLVYLERFANIRLGDLMVMPAEREKFDVHLGIVIPNGKRPQARPRSVPYYYHYDVRAGEWYEDAHKVPVLWNRESAGGWAVVSIPHLGGLWPTAFGRVVRAKNEIIDLAKQAGFEMRAV